jgi:hypothetical protein
MRWLLLTLTVLSLWLTIDAIRWKIGAKDIPFSAISSLWKGGLEHLSLVEREAVRQRYRSSLWGIGAFVLLFAAVSVMLVVLTVRAFLEGGAF